MKEGEFCHTVPNGLAGVKSGGLKVRELGVVGVRDDSHFQESKA